LQLFFTTPKRQGKRGIGKKGERACRENFKDFNISLERRKEFNECLLEYLP
jgi:hypothetical protein